jgi:amino acid adenylation domain-containing protein
MMVDTIENNKNLNQIDLASNGNDEFSASVDFLKLWLPDQIDQSAKNRSQQVAIISRDQEITYGEIVCSANKIAKSLQNLGVVRNKIVGICLDRSPEFIISVIGILKSGGAFVSVDPKSTKQNIEAIFDETQVEIIITNEKTKNRFCNKKYNLLVYDDVRSQTSCNKPSIHFQKNDLACVIYTTGSSDTPKGVSFSHSNLSNFVQIAQDAIRYRSDDRCLFSSAVTFVVVIRQILVPLAVGAQVIIADSEHLANPHQFFCLIKTEQVTTMDIVPSYWRVIMDWLSAVRVETRVDLLNNKLRQIVSGGELLLSDLPQRWAREFQHPAQIINVLGQTETTGIVSNNRLSFQIEETIKPLPIGKPNKKTKIFVLNSGLNPVGKDEIGEILISSPCVALGYFKKMKLTAEKFIPNPYSSIPGSRLYRTGDLGRYCQTGEIEIVGRVDQQVKIRGIRVDLNEIRIELLNLSKVNEAAVVDFEFSENEKHLVACLVLKNDADYSESLLRDTLAKSLPEVMIPTIFLIFRDLPFKSNGKMDYQKLRSFIEKRFTDQSAQIAPGNDSDISRPLSENYTPPNNTIEDQLAKIWSDILLIGRVGIHDNFFTLGGNSLLAIRIITQIVEKFDIEILISEMFAADTVAKLAKSLQIKIHHRKPLEATILNSSDQTETNYLSRQYKVSNRDINLDYDSVSGVQESFWLLQQLTPDIPIYNLPKILSLKGDLKVELLEKSLKGIISRHQTLRTTYHLGDGALFQRVSHDWGFDFTMVDFSELSQQDRSQKLQKLLQEMIRQPFDLENGLMIRSVLVRLRQDHHILGLVIHHIASDFLSSRLFENELAVHYDAYLNQETPTLPDLPISYQDYATWQSDFLKTETATQKLIYWRDQLEDSPSLLQLPTDFPRQPIQTYAGNRISFSINAELFSEVLNLSSTNGVTPFMVLLTAFYVLLHRYTHQTDILVGMPVVGRFQPEMEYLIGAFINTVALRCKIAKRSTFLELLQSVRNITLQALDHQEIPFSTVVRDINPERNNNYSPLFQVMINYLEDRNPLYKIGDLEVDHLPNNNGTSMFDLSLIFKIAGDELSAEFEYNPELFETATITRMIAHFQVLLTNAVLDPNQLVSNISIIPAKNYQQIITSWNAAEEPYPADVLIHHLFEDWARLTPYLEAVVFHDQKYTFRELNSRANQIADFLIKHGTTPETRVAFALNRSTDSIITILGILKSGAAYVPLDISFPEERLTFIIRDSMAMIVIAHQDIQTQLPSLDIPVYVFEEIVQANSSEEIVNPNIEIYPKNLAYIMYTSGSTGQPKGVLISHQNVIGFLWGYKQVNLDGPRRIGTTVAPFNFDTSIDEIFSTICFGGCLHILLPEESSDVAYFANYLVNNAITTAYIVPDFLPGIAQYLESYSDQFQLECLITGLAPKREHVLQNFRDLSTDLRILNAYGPTEVTYGATAFEFVKTENPDHDVSIGVPFPNYDVYIVDSILQPVPIGVTGELLIGGVGISRGYQNKPEMTAVNFIPDPFSSKPGNRLYRTGDLVRYRLDGNIDFLGRADDQVKVRGYRIELGEIESALYKFSAVEKTKVIVSEEVTGDQRLVAYIVMKDRKEIPINHLREFLESKLPVYMIPNQFMFLLEFPLMANGKISYRDLPTPDISRQLLETEFEAPSSPEEEILINIWSDILGVDCIGIHDNFFELGGHSLLASHVMLEIENQFGTRLPLAAFFETSTIALLAVKLKVKHHINNNWLSLVPMKPDGNRPPIFIVHSLGGNIIGYRDIGKYLDPDQPLYGLQSLGLDGKSSLNYRIEDMAADYIKEILNFYPEGPLMLAGHSFGGWVAVEMAIQLQQQGCPIALLALIDTATDGLGFTNNIQKIKFKSKSLFERMSFHAKNIIFSTKEERKIYLEKSVMRYRRRRNNKNLGAKVLKEEAIGSAIPKYLDSVKQANFLASHLYTVKKFPGKVTLFRAKNQGVGRLDREFYGWKAFASDVDVYEIPGNHLTIITEPNVQILATKLQFCIDETLAQSDIELT